MRSCTLRRESSHVRSWYHLAATQKMVEALRRDGSCSCWAWQNLRVSGLCADSMEANSGKHAVGTSRWKHSPRFEIVIPTHRWKLCTFTLEKFGYCLSDLTLDPLPTCSEQSTLQFSICLSSFSHFGIEHEMYLPSRLSFRHFLSQQMFHHF